MKLNTIPESTPDLRGMRVLVIDDSLIACDIFNSQLSSLSYDVSVAFSGEEGIRKIEQAAAGKQPYDLVIVDWIMPAMDGFETAGRIRALPGLSPAPKIVMATAYGCREAAQRAQSAGLDGYLTKPSSLSGLFDVIMCAFGKGNLEPGRSHREKDFGLAGLEGIRGASALLVEDNEYNQLVASELLKSVGLLVTIADNGRKALDTLNTSPFDIVLMDIQMPVMDGYEATRCIRTDPVFNTLPIIAMTAHAMATDRDKCITAGMNDYVSKPIDPDTLFAVLVKWIKPGERKPAAADDLPPLTDMDGMVYLPHTLPGIFVGAGLRMCNNNKRLYRDLLVRFRNERRNTDGDIRDALNANDTAAAARIAHTMKSVAGTLGAKELSESAVLLEKAINSAGPQAAEVPLAVFASSLRLVVDGLDAAFRDVETGARALSGTGRPTELVERQRVTQILKELSGLLQRDVGLALKQFDTLNELLPEGPALELFVRIEQQMSEFDIEGVRVSLRELARVLELPEEVS
jgi:CheY-like chemotaxis protein